MGEPQSQEIDFSWKKCSFFSPKKSMCSKTKTSNLIINFYVQKKPGKLKKKFIRQFLNDFGHRFRKFHIKTNAFKISITACT